MLDDNWAYRTLLPRSPTESPYREALLERLRGSRDDVLQGLELLHSAGDGALAAALLGAFIDFDGSAFVVRTPDMEWAPYLYRSQLTLELLLVVSRQLLDHGIPLHADEAAQLERILRDAGGYKRRINALERFAQRAQVFEDEHGYPPDIGSDEESVEAMEYGAEAQARYPGLLSLWAQVALRQVDRQDVELIDLSYLTMPRQLLGGLRGGAFPSLHTLRLRFTSLDAECAAVLASLPLQSVQTLQLTGNPLGPAGARALATSPNLGALRTLDLRDTAIHAKGAAAFAAATGMPALEWVHLYMHDVTPRGAAALAGSKTLPVQIRRFWQGRLALLSRRKESTR